MANQNHSKPQPSKIIGRVTIRPQPHAPELLHPTERPLNVPAEFTQAAPAGSTALSEQRFNVAMTQLRAVPFVIVAAIALQTVGTPTWPSDLSGDGRHRIEQRDGLRDIIAVGGGQMHRQRHSAGVGDQVDLTAGLATIHGTGASFCACAERSQMATVNQEAAEVDLFQEAQIVQETLVDVRPDAHTTPPTQPPPAGHAAAATHFLWQILPRDTGPQDEQNAGERFAVVDGRSPTFGAQRVWRQIGANGFPQVIGKKWSGHGRTSFAMQLTPEDRFRYYYINRNAFGQYC